MSNNIEIYIDGASSKKNNAGGIGAICVVDGKVARGFVVQTTNSTNNQMELTALYMALLLCWEYSEDSEIPTTKVNIYTDSEYTKKGLNEWLRNWKRNHWRNAAGEPVKNSVIWKCVDELHTHIKGNFASLKVNWVKGHSGNIGNEISDKLSVAGYKKPHYDSNEKLQEDLRELFPEVVVQDITTIDLLNKDYSSEKFQKALFPMYPGLMQLINITDGE